MKICLVELVSLPYYVGTENRIQYLTAELQLMSYYSFPPHTCPSYFLGAFLFLSPCFCRKNFTTTAKVASPIMFASVLMKRIFNLQPLCFSWSSLFYVTIEHINKYVSFFTVNLCISILFKQS